MENISMYIMYVLYVDEIIISSKNTDCYIFLTNDKQNMKLPSHASYSYLS